MEKKLPGARRMCNCRGSSLADGTDNAASVELGEDARLAEAVKYHLRDRNRRPSEPAGVHPLLQTPVYGALLTSESLSELLAAVQNSLRETAASLKDDSWMYEAEDER